MNVLLVSIVLGLLVLALHRLPLSPEASRKGLHLGMGSLCLTFPWLFDSATEVDLLAGISVGALLLVRWLKPSFGGVRHRISRLSFGELLFPVGVPFTQRWKTLPTDGPPTELDGDHPALITFTSGSTGTPKGLVRSHRFLLSQDRILAPHLDLRPGQVDLVTLPVFLLSNLAHGVTSVIADTDLTRPGFPNAKRILAQVRKHHITRCTASPAFFAKMPDAFFDPLETFHTGGAPVFPEVLRRFPEKAHAVYGSSEAEPIAHFPGSALTPGMIEAIRSGAGLPAGRPVDDIEVRLVDEEILVTGDHVLKGYLDGRGDAKQKVKIDEQIWHRTGDAGRFDSRGNLWLLGRHHCKWRDYFPRQIEAAVHLQHPGHACAFHHGTLFLESDLPIDLPWAPIDRIEVIPEIPMDRRHNAKIDHSRLTRRPASTFTFFRQLSPVLEQQRVGRSRTGPLAGRSWRRDPQPTQAAASPLLLPSPARACAPSPAGEAGHFWCAC